MVCFNLGTKQIIYSTDHAPTLLGFLPVKKRKMEIEGGNAGLGEDVSRHGLTSLEIMLLETFTLLASSSSIPKEHISVLSRAVFFLCKPQRNATETGFEVTLAGKARRFFPGLLSSCHDISEANGMSSTPHEANRYYSFVRCTVTFESMVHGRKRPSRLLAETIETRGQVQSL